MFPLRGLWNHAPSEGDYFVNAEIDWLVTTKSTAVQFSLSGNSPVSLSQIVALSVDNSRSGADCDFIFPDSGFVLTVPAHNQLIAPVFTNALMFYAAAPNAIAGDVTVLQILNSMPPPIPIAPSSAQNHYSVTGAPTTNGNTQLVPAGISGTLNTIAFSAVISAGGSLGTAQFSLVDGAAHPLWIISAECPASTSQPFNQNVTGLAVRFQNGIVLNVAGSNLTGSYIDCNVYYSTP
jgi:hypothetical protein